MADKNDKKDDFSGVEAAIKEIMREDIIDPDVVSTAEEEESVEEGIDESSEEIAMLIAERDSLRDKFMRALADAENARKRSERDRREAENYGGSRLARDMLPVYDNMNRALGLVTDEIRGTTGGLIEGLELTMRELLNIFERHGITKVAPEVGDAFDPQIHEAMFEAPVPGSKAGDIIEVMTEGFMLHDRLLRPAQVGVSSTPE
ncbi:MAG: nucleotide exchange factor GrpE [Rhodobacterales bacterium]|nr:MAG: nucleotide exchange factor GrpE [Rhodobacterales bacterium]